jgi:hypothetical protein
LTATTEIGRPAPYFVNLPVDFVLIGGGSILLFLILPLFHDGTRTAGVAEVGLWLTWIANWPHFSATSYRLYGRTEHLRQYPITAVAAPLIVLAGILASFTWPLAVAPYFVKMFLLWSPYHYSGQTLGISLLYGRRAGHRPGSLERFLLSAFIYGTFLMRTLGGEVSTRGSVYYGVQVPGFGVPRWVATGFSAWTYACGAALLAVLAVRAVRSRKAPPFMYLLPPVTQYVWFVVAGAKPGYAEFVPFFHGVQYLVIAWAMQLKEQADRRVTSPSLRSICLESVRWYAMNALGGAALFYALPHFIARTGVGLSFAMAVILTGIQIHHFFVDGVIWKLKARSVISPLLVNIPDLVASGATSPLVREVAG